MEASVEAFVDVTSTEAFVESTFIEAVVEAFLPKLSNWSKFSSTQAFTEAFTEAFVEVPCFRRSFAEVNFLPQKLSRNLLQNLTLILTLSPSPKWKLPWKLS